MMSVTATAASLHSGEPAVPAGTDVSDGRHRLSLMRVAKWKLQCL